VNNVVNIDMDKVTAIVRALWCSSDLSLLQRVRPLFDRFDPLESQSKQAEGDASLQVPPHAVAWPPQIHGALLKAAHC
jgi:hypothetical protein